MRCSTLLSRALPAWIFFFFPFTSQLPPPPSPVHTSASQQGGDGQTGSGDSRQPVTEEENPARTSLPLCWLFMPSRPSSTTNPPSLLPSPPSLPPLLQWGNQGCEVPGPRKCSHISKGSWAPCGSSPEKEKVKMNTVGEDEGTRAELINISSGCERTPAQADPGLLPALFSSLKEKKHLSTVHF